MEEIKRVFWFDKSKAMLPDRFRECCPDKGISTTIVEPFRENYPGIEA
ncbi:hypothetical protein ADU37_CDS09010 [Thermococcus sp. 2319x1]|nr:hypothetical protein [Thermococcus sp. 2319x1]ALV62600.1 hypothetical protein ADU37_CDS09010 [Thermococcus sp. 2319x1]